MKATHLDQDAGLVSYRVASCASADVRCGMAGEYNKRKEELESDEAPAGLEALLWWNEYRGLATLRVSPWLFNTYRARISTVLESRGSVERLWQLKNQDCGWRLQLTGDCSFPGFRDTLASFLAGFIIADNPQMSATRAALGATQEPDRKDESLMKKLFPVLVCERKAKKEGDAKEDGEFLKGFAPKFVPAVSAVAASTKVMAELIEAKKFGDPDDPDVAIKVCNPFA